MTSDSPSRRGAHKRSQTLHIFGPTASETRASSSHSHRRCKSTGSLTLDIQGLSLDDFKALHAKDPFLYYSIPGVRKAAITSKDVDFSDAAALCRDDPIHREERRAEEEEEEEDAAAAFAGSNTLVIRKSKLSFEVDPFSLVAADTLATIDEVPDAVELGKGAENGSTEASEDGDDDSTSDFCRVAVAKAAPLRCSKELFQENPKLMLSVLFDMMRM